MTAISDLLNAGQEEFVRKLLPAGEYLCQIIEAELKHGYWKANPEKNRGPRWMEVYVPTIQLVDVVPTGDPDIDEAMMNQLEVFGDWKGYKPPNGSGRWMQMQTVPGFNDKVQCAGIANGLNYIMAETTPEWAAMKELASSAPRFYTSQNSQGQVDGFVNKVLSTSPDQHVPPVSEQMKLDEIIAATKGCFLQVSLKVEEDPSGEYEPKIVCDGVASV